MSSQQPNALSEIQALYDPADGRIQRLFDVGDFYVDETTRNDGVHFLGRAVMGAYLEDFREQTGQDPGRVRVYEQAFTDRCVELDQFTADDRFMTALTDKARLLYGELPIGHTSPDRLLLSLPSAGLRRVAHLAGTRSFVVDGRKFTTDESLFHETFASEEGYVPGWFVSTVEATEETIGIVQSDIAGATGNSSLAPIIATSEQKQPTLAAAMKDLVRNAYLDDDIRREAHAVGPERFLEVMTSIRKHETLVEDHFVIQSQAASVNSLLDTCIRTIRTEIEEAGMSAVLDLAAAKKPIDHGKVQKVLQDTVRARTLPLLEAYAEAPVIKKTDTAEPVDDTAMLISNQAITAMRAAMKKSDVMVMGHDEVPGKREGGYVFFNWKNDFYITIFPASKSGYSWLRADQLTEVARLVAAKNSLYITNMITMGAVAQPSFH